MTREQIVAEARKWLDTPYHHQGRLLGVGVDCIGIAVAVARAFDIPVDDRADYPMHPHDRELERELARHCDTVTEPGAGDIVLIRFLGEPQHVAIDCGATLLHCHNGAGRCVEHPWNEKWNARAYRRFRFPGVTD